MQRLLSTSDSTLNQNFTRLQSAIAALEEAIGGGGDGGGALWGPGAADYITPTPAAGVQVDPTLGVALGDPSAGGPRLWSDNGATAILHAEDGATVTLDSGGQGLTFDGWTMLFPNSGTIAFGDTTISLQGNWGSMNFAAGVYQFSINNSQIAFLDDDGFLLVGKTLTPGSKGVGVAGRRGGEIQWTGTALQVWDGTAWRTITLE
jgi:hypothetical protein